MSANRTRLALAGTALLFALAGTAQADEPPNDLQRARAAQAALAADPELARLNLGVTVTGNVVRVWGLADPGKARRAVEAIRKAGSGEVRDETNAPPTPRPFVPKSPPVTLPAGEEPPAPTAARPEPPAPPVPVAEIVTGPVPGPAVLPASVADVSRFRGPAVKGVPTATGTPALTAAVPEAEPVPVLAERARRGDPRWSGLSVTHDDGVLKLAGNPAGGWSAVWELADRLRALPGVREVDVTGVRIGR